MRPETKGKTRRLIDGQRAIQQVSGDVSDQMAMKTGSLRFERTPSLKSNHQARRRRFPANFRRSSSWDPGSAMKQ
jgi:hypothetical protein